MTLKIVESANMYVEKKIHIVSVESVNHVPVAILFARGSASTLIQTKIIVELVERSVLVPNQLVPMVPAESARMN